MLSILQHQTSGTNYHLMLSLHVPYHLLKLTLKLIIFSFHLDWSRDRVPQIRLRRFGLCAPYKLLFSFSFFINFNEWIRFCPTAGQSYCVNLWHDHRFKEPVLQGGHAIWSLGAAIGPFIIRPFLSELQYDGHSDAVVNNVSTLINGWNTTHLLDGSIIQHSPDNQLVHHQSPDGDHVNITNISDVMSVRFAYVTIGLIILIFGIPFFAIFLANCFSNRKKSSDESDRSIKDGDETTTKGSPSSSCNPIRAIFLVMLSYFTFLLVYIEGIPIAYYVTFCIKYLDWPVRQASLLMTIFFGAHFSGRVLGVPLSAYLAPRTMLIMNLFLSTTANVLLMFVNFFPAIMWISAAMAGFGVSSTFPTIILWVSELIQVTGFVSSVLSVGASMGFFTAPLLVGLMFDATPMSMVYILLIVSICLFLFFLLQLAFVFKFKHRLRPSSAAKDLTTW